ncbi:homing endonuclease associated repeat-containing protein [Nitrosomonas sp. Nm33]|uniref:homing endonuclease associated repeat-containing protein n=1 Tax=Nitrosomonas sp. Nm33 TaxID=133724 RepID=UPI00089D4372|nr:HNH endonuclease [Nitrosomonas sp. Nm33]SDY06936.1 HNH endonuclease [Nitrosomonas sp. Nm33]
MQFKLSHDRKSIADEDLLSDLQCVAQEHADICLKQRTYKEFGKYGVTTVIRRFGSWNTAIEKAGLEKFVERNIPDQKLFAAIYDLWIKLGRQPSYSEIQRPHCYYSAKPYEQRFGSWRKALEAFVEYINTKEISTPFSRANDIQLLQHRSTSRSINLRLRFKVLQRDNFRCCACGVSPAITPGIQLEVDHIVPWSKGGETVIDNLQTLCFACNQGKSNHHVSQ